MTPLEAKGLEFEDVFVCNFFHDSPESANWDALEEFLSAHTAPITRSTGTHPLIAYYITDVRRCGAAEL